MMNNASNTDPMPLSPLTLATLRQREEIYLSMAGWNLRRSLTQGDPISLTLAKEDAMTAEHYRLAIAARRAR